MGLSILFDAVKRISVKVVEKVMVFKIKEYIQNDYHMFTNKTKDQV